MKHYQTILVPTDYSKSADNALAHAIQLAAACGARLCVVHVVEPFERSYFEHVGVSEGHEAEGEGPRLEQHVRKMLGRMRVPHSEEVAWGDPAECILRMARKGPGDVIVLGARGTNPLVRLVMGSVAERVVHLATCPVLVVKQAKARRRRAGSALRAA